MNCPRCDSPAETQALRQFGGVCPKCLLEFAAEKDAPSFPNLEILSTLGEGGMGVVYKAVQKPLGRTVALKVLSPQLATDPSFVERFTREAKALASLSHPNIVAIHDFGVHDGVPYLLMEYVDGTPLRKLLAAKKLTAEQALDVVPQICDALQYAHGRGVVHRDVKPENILIDREGRVKIADFGLAKLAAAEQTRITRTNMLMGTPHYMAPEQIENPSAVDHRADIYSLGVIFYEMLTGELPLGRFKPPSAKAPVDRRLDPVVLKSLEKEPADRYQSAGEVKEHVTRLESVPVTSAGQDEEDPGFSWFPWMVPMVLGLIALALVVSGQRQSALWTAVAGGIMAIFALPSGLPRGRRRRSNPSTAIPNSPFAEAAALIAILGTLGMIGAFVLVVFELRRVAELVFTVGSCLMLAALVISLVALGHIAHRRGAVGGRKLGLSALGISFAGLALSSFLLLRTSAPARPGAPWIVSPPPPRANSTAFRLEDAWPREQDLPDRLTYDLVLEGEALFKDGEVAGGPALEMRADLKQVRYATLLNHEIYLVGYEFKSDLSRMQWEKEPLQDIVLVGGSPPAGHARFEMGLLLRESSAEAKAMVERLRPFLEKRMLDAARRYPRNK